MIALPEYLIEMVIDFLLPFFRVASFIMVVPIFGNQFVPIRIKLLLSLLVSVLIYPLVGEIPLVEPLSIAMIFIVLEQIFIGVFLAFVLQIFFHIFVLAAQMIAMPMGLGFASMIDPTNGISVTVLSQFYALCVTLLFLSFNGHLILFEIFIQSFSFVPIGAETLSKFSPIKLVSMGSWMLSSALLISLPAITAILIVNFSFGVMTRSAPQLNIFSLGFPFTLMFGLLIIWFSFANFIPQFENLTGEVFLKLKDLLGS